MKTHVFKVEGRGTFPVDMLRYDQCWPATTDAAMSIVHLDYSKVREAEMVSHRQPTPARWESFGWKVTSSNTFKD